MAESGSTNGGRWQVAQVATRTVSHVLDCRLGQHGLQHGALFSADAGRLPGFCGDAGTEEHMQTETEKMPRQYGAVAGSRQYGAVDGHTQAGSPLMVVPRRRFIMHVINVFMTF